MFVPKYDTSISLLFLIANDFYIKYYYITLRVYYFPLVIQVFSIDLLFIFVRLHIGLPVFLGTRKSISSTE